MFIAISVICFIVFLTLLYGTSDDSEKMNKEIFNGLGLGLFVGLICLATIYYIKESSVVPPLLLDQPVDLPVDTLIGEENK